MRIWFSSFNRKFSTVDDLGREIKAVKTCVSTRIAKMEQISMENWLLVSQKLKQFTDMISNRLIEIEICLKQNIEDANNGDYDREVPTERPVIWNWQTFHPYPLLKGLERFNWAVGKDLTWEELFHDSSWTVASTYSYWITEIKVPWSLAYSGWIFKARIILIYLYQKSSWDYDKIVSRTFENNVNWFKQKSIN